jgi:hypothetical protein
MAKQVNLTRLARRIIAESRISNPHNTPIVVVIDSYSTEDFVLQSHFGAGPYTPFIGCSAAWVHQQPWASEFAA